MKNIVASGVVILLLIGLLHSSKGEENKEEAVGLLWGGSEAPCDVADLEGHVSIQRSLGVIKVDKYTYIPVVYAFNSCSERVDPLLGYGWSFLLANSKIVLLDDDLFELTNVDGSKIKLTRDKSDGTLLHGCGLRGRVRSNQITLNFNNGWNFTYTKGILSSMQTPTKHNLLFRYGKDNRLLEIVDGENKLLQSEFEPDSSSVRINSNKYIVNMAKRPVVFGLANSPIKERYEPSLLSIHAEPYEATEEFRYMSDKDSLGMIIHTSTDRLVTWNAGDRKIVCDGCDLVKIKVDPKQPGKYSVEYWQENVLVASKVRDYQKGIYRETKRDKSSYSLETFTSGILAGKQRRVTFVGADGIEERLKYDYDESGGLLRIIHLK